MNRKYCSGCYNDLYNTKEKNCWHLKDAKVIWRKKIHIDQPPPWTQPHKQYPDCYTQQRYFFQDKE